MRSCNGAEDGATCLLTIRNTPTLDSWQRSPSRRPLAPLASLCRPATTRSGSLIRCEARRIGRSGRQGAARVPSPGWCPVSRPPPCTRRPWARRNDHPQGGRAARLALGSPSHHATQKSTDPTVLGSGVSGTGLHRRGGGLWCSPQATVAGRRRGGNVWREQERPAAWGEMDLGLAALRWIHFCGRGSVLPSSERSECFSFLQWWTGFLPGLLSGDSLKAHSKAPATTGSRPAVGRSLVFDS